MFLFFNKKNGFEKKNQMKKNQGEKILKEEVLVHHVQRKLQKKHLM